MRRGDATEATAAPVVVIGAGPVGVRVVSELARRDPRRDIVLYGEEEAEPYDRVQLSSLLLGEVTEDALRRDMQLPHSPRVELRLGVRVTHLDRCARVVRDARGGMQAYGKLVLATGSAPHVPDIPGIALRGVYRFRDWRDVQQLCARRARSRRTVVLGGGLLGLETARAMRRFHTEVVVIDHNTHLLARQLDAAAGEVLRRHVEAQGIRVVLGEAMRRVRGHDAVAGVELHSGELLDCDTIVLATGIRPNIDLARQSGVAVNRGIRVDDRLRSSDPDVHAVGECAEHRGAVHGLVGPGLEQAAVVAGVLAGADLRYAGSIAATRLKVAGLPVFSTGVLADNDLPRDCRRHHWRNGDAITTLVTHRGRLVGACGVGTLREFQPLREAVARGRYIAPWRLWRHRRDGRLWPERDEADIAAWPADAVVCNCANVTRGQLSGAITAGCGTLQQISTATRASSACGSCRPLVLRMLAGGRPVPPVRGARLLVSAAVLALLVVGVALLAGNLPDAVSVATPVAVPPFWRDAAFKQLSGYTLVALVLLSLAITIRKRVVREPGRAARSDTALWRMAHAGLAVSAALVLLSHTGGRVGSNMNLALSLCFLVALGLGAAAALAVAREHRATAAVRLRRRMTFIHLLCTWPLPALLVAHVTKAYFF